MFYFIVRMCTSAITAATIILPEGIISLFCNVGNLPFPLTFWTVYSLKHWIRGQDVNLMFINLCTGAPISTVSCTCRSGGPFWVPLHALQKWGEVYFALDSSEPCRGCTHPLKPLWASEWLLRQKNQKNDFRFSVKLSVTFSCLPKADMGTCLYNTQHRKQTV